MRGSPSWCVVLAVLFVLPLVTGCPKKPGKDGVGGAGAGLGEEGLTGTGSSLERAKRGLSPEEDGVLKDIHFGYDKSDVDSSARDALTRNIEWLRQNPKAKVELEGHADSRGTIEYNLGLGARRAKGVKDYLAGQGVSADRLSTISYGKELPLCRDENDACWARNRRVHFVVLGQ